jgi:microcystin-dependent protein
VVALNVNAFRQILFSTVLFMSTQAMSECNPQAHLGSICWMAGDYCPRGYAKANGQMMPISDNTALFSLLSTNYGGDGRVTFQLPDLMGRVAIGEGVGPGMIPRRLSQRVGAEKRMLYPNQVPGQHALTLSNLSYQGSVAAVTETGTTNSPAGNYPAQSAVGKLYDPVGESQFHSGSVEITRPVNLTLTTDSVGSPVKRAIFLREPQLGLTACISTMGPYPPRS